MAYLIENAMTPALRFLGTSTLVTPRFFQKKSGITGGWIVAISRHLSVLPSHYFWVVSSLLP